MKARDLLSREEIRQLTQASDLRGAWSLISDWAWIAGAFALVAWAPSVWTVGLALVVLGSRQLALAVLTHECAHYSLFATRRVHDPIGRWLCAAPIWTDVHRYRVHHHQHHAFTGTERDPDMGLVTPFPTTRASLARKFARDLLGLTALRRVYGLLAMDLGFIAYTASTNVEPLPAVPVGERLSMATRHLGPVLLANGALFAALALTGHPWLYLLWVGAWCTTYSLFLRIRSIAEHACTKDSPVMVDNTRTTQATALTGFLFAPHDVNFHVEHHLVMTVPHYRLRAMHDLLCERGVFASHNSAPGYGSVLARVTSR